MIVAGHVKPVTQHSQDISTLALGNTTDHFAGLSIDEMDVGRVGRHKQQRVTHGDDSVLSPAKQ